MGLASEVETVNGDSNLAVFCDFENIALGVRDAKLTQFDIRPVIERLLLKGSIVAKKAYCDWERYKESRSPRVPCLRQSAHAGRTPTESSR